MMRLTLVCCALGSVLMLVGCGGSSSDASPGGGAGGAAQSSGGKGQTSGGAQSAGGKGQTSGGAQSAGGSGQTSGGAQSAGGSGQTSGGAATTDVPGSTVLGSLTDAQATTLCMDLGKSAAYTTLNDLSCRTSGLFAALLSGATTDAAVQAACTTAYTQCIGSAGSLMCDSKPTAACMATVSEYLACVNDEAAAAATLSGQIPMCSALTVANVETSLSDGGASTPPATPASCTLAQQLCPELGSDNGQMM